MIANQNAAHTVVRAFRRHGVEVAFGQSIPTAFHLVAPGYGIRQFAYRTENAGAAMADGYARISGRVAVVTAQNGPAATLLVPGLAEALKASIPIVALVQDVARGATDRNAFQELDHLDLFRGVAKWVRRVAQADRIDDYVDMAFTAAAGGRPGPAVLIVPIDLFQDAAPAESGRVASLGAYPLDRPQADPAAVAAAADLLAAAEHPLVVAGGGVHSSGAAAALAALQERAHLPVGTTSMGKGAVDEGHPLSVGVIGYFMGRRGMGKFMRPLVDRADVVLLVGNRTNQNGTDSWKLFPRGARFLHLDIDGAEIGRNYEAMRLQGDARATLAALTEALARRDLGKRATARPALEAAIRAGRQAHAEEAAPVTGSSARPMRPERIMAEIDRRLTPDTIVVADASYASIWINNYLRARRPGQRFLTPRGIAGLGWGLPMAIGAKVASPSSPVVCVAGDGGFAHVWAELETARRMGTPIPITVLNNQILGYQKHAETATHGAYTDAVEFAPVDHAAIARACGCAGVRIEDPADYGPALEAALAADVPTVIDVVTDPAAYPPVTMFDGKLGGV
ncbi:acetolactate synthase catalytic subunit [Stella sp.]|uniref:acetolactate synthase catalytic subunit n=1 Tax=Stella sp. TaxID=2912054 RepID=UPI0035ADBD11